MKHIINFSDFHMHFFKDFSEPDPEYGTDRAREQVMILDNLLKYAKSVGGDVLFNGDLFHKRVSIDVRLFNMLFNVFSAYPEVEVFLLSGNHDKVTNSLFAESALEPFGALPNVTVCSTYGVYVRDGYTIYAVSYGDEVEEMKEWIAEQSDLLDKTTVNILCAHVGVDGSSTGSYSHTLGGAFTVADLYPDKFDIVTLGHYHKRQFLGGLDNIFYVGNTLQTSFADEGQEKGYYDIKITKGNPHKQHGSYVELDFIKTDYTPFEIVTADSASSTGALDKAYTQFIGTPEEAEAVRKIKEKNNLKNIRIKVQKDYYVEPRINISAGSTPEEVTHAFIDKKYKNADPLRIKALDCLKEATQI